jgi:hypothetical protein
VRSQKGVQTPLLGLLLIVGYILRDLLSWFQVRKARLSKRRPLAGRPVIIMAGRTAIPPQGFGMLALSVDANSEIWMIMTGSASAPAPLWIAVLQRVPLMR